MSVFDEIVSHFAAGAERIDTQGAVVLLKGERALKLRRPIKLPFLDYSTLERRRAAAQAEIALNQPQAPHIYIGATPIRRARDGFALDGEGEIVEWATLMRRFDENATLDRLAARGALGEAAMRALARAIHAMHAHSPSRDAAPALVAMANWIEQNAASFAAAPDLFDAATARALAAASRAALQAAAPLLSARGAAGFCRRCHGDLHLGNIVMLDGAPTPFDAIEFDDEIATGDVLYDLAFALMDLWERGLKADANLLINAYLAHGPAEHLDALAALPLFLSLRAAIRAKVEANALTHLDEAARAAKAVSARRYFDFAGRFLKPEPARLVAVGGLSGSGKSLLAKALAPDIGPAPGAVWLRSDVERKAMFGVAEETRLPQEAYSAAAGQAVYARLFDKAARALKAGAGVLVDATFAHAHERAAVAALHAHFVGLWLEAPLATRLQRVGARTHDASDADATVAQAQRAEPLTERGWRLLDASGEAAVVASQARACI